MDTSGLGGGFLSGSDSGILDLESPIRRHPQSHPAHQSLVHHHQMNMMGAGLETDHHPIGLIEPKGSIQRGISMNFGKGKAVCGGSGNVNTSDDDEPSFNEDGHCENLNFGKGTKESPWQRMKWTDNVVRLLIAVVACVGDDGSLDGSEGMKRKAGILQKKGKWKTVSKIMISKGCYVSPQQCEDKFNDLNKRYKRLNEILGRGTSCRVVENPVLMDSMPQLSEKLKNVVRKILSSKHLFYQEMCAYHNGQRIPNCHDLDLQNYSNPLTICSKDNNNGSEEEDAREHHEHHDSDNDHDHDDDESDNEDGHNAEYGERKRMHEEDNFLLQHDGNNSFEAEIAGIFQDPTKSTYEQREWIRNRMSQLQEQRVGCLTEAFELEKRRFKWQRFCSKKDRELERARLENERRKLENEKMELILKQKEMELDFKRSSEGSMDPPSLGIDRFQGRDHIDLGRHLQ